MSHSFLLLAARCLPLSRRQLQSVDSLATASMWPTCGASDTEKGGSGSHVPWWRKRCALVLLLCFAALLVLVTVVIATLIPGFAAVTEPEVPLLTSTEVSTQISDAAEFTLPDGRPIVRRSEWSSVAPDFRTPLRQPAPYVVVGHTAGPACTDKARCFALLRDYRDEHRSRWLQPDISYNFLIDMSGNVYEGRGWDAASGYRSWVSRCNLAVTLLGNFMEEEVTPAMARSLRQLLGLGVALGRLHPDYRLLAHNQLAPTLSPGANALRAIGAWPHRCLQHCAEGVRCAPPDA